MKDEWLDIDDKEISYRDMVASLLPNPDGLGISERLGSFLDFRLDGIYMAPPPESVWLTDEERCELFGHPQNDFTKPALAFPFTPKQLKKFLAWTESEGIDVEIDMHRLAKRVASKPQITTRQTLESDAALGAHTRAQMKAFSERSLAAKKLRHTEHKRWKACGLAIQAGRQKPASKRHLAELIKNELGLPDSTDTIRKRL